VTIIVLDYFPDLLIGQNACADCRKIFASTTGTARTLFGVVRTNLDVPID